MPPTTMHITPTAIPGVLVIEPKVFGDARGFFYESFNQKAFNEATGLNLNFVQDNHSLGTKGVLRGSVFDVAVEIRKASPTFGQWVGMELSEENHKQLWIPAGFAHGFMVTSDSAEFLYKTTDHYAPEHERCIAWNDPALDIQWPLAAASPSLSAKDQHELALSEAETF